MTTTTAPIPTIGRGFHHFAKGHKLTPGDLPLLTEGTIFLGEFMTDGKLCRNTYIVTRVPDFPVDRPLIYAKYYWPKDHGAVVIQPTYPMAFWAHEFDDPIHHYYLAV